MQSWKQCALPVITTMALWELMHLGPERDCKSFTQYAKELFIIYLKLYTKSVQRLDLVFDRCFEDSLKVELNQIVEQESVER